MNEIEKLFPNNCSELVINMLMNAAGFVKLLHPSCKLKETLSSLKIIYLSDFFSVNLYVFFYFQILLGRIFHSTVLDLCISHSTVNSVWI